MISVREILSTSDENIMTNYLKGDAFRKFISCLIKAYLLNPDDSFCSVHS